jgi:hypothetical protein
MTNALLKILKQREVRKLRRRRGCSVQYVFNRMVGEMPEDEEEEEEGDDEDEESESESNDSSSDEEEDAEATRAKLRMAFAQFDVDGNGTLSANELVKLLTRESGQREPLTVEDAQEIVECFDTDDDGALSLDELVDAWSQIVNGEEEEDDDDEVTPGQHLNLSWPGGCDPSSYAFPF